MDDTKKKFNLNSQTNLDDLKGRLAYINNIVLGIITDIITISPPESTADNYMWNYPTTYEATIINKDCNSNTVDLSKVTDISTDKYTYKEEGYEGYSNYYYECYPQIVLESDAGGKRTRNKRRRQTRRKSKKGKSRRKQQRR